MTIIKPGKKYIVKEAIDLLSDITNKKNITEDIAIDTTLFHISNEPQGYYYIANFSIDDPNRPFGSFSAYVFPYDPSDPTVKSIFQKLMPVSSGGRNRKTSRRRRRRRRTNKRT
jgi:hypothetical protein